MSESERLAEQFERALDGGAWHGPAWREVLDGVNAESAWSRPIHGVHTIAEIVLHATTWHRVVLRRLKGERVDASPKQDWPDSPAATQWQALVDDLVESARDLCRGVRRFPCEKLGDPRPGERESWYHLIVGELQHDLYHLGQVALLKKATERESRIR